MDTTMWLATCCYCFAMHQCIMAARGAASCAALKHLLASDSQPLPPHSVEWIVLFLFSHCSIHLWALQCALTVACSQRRLQHSQMYRAVLKQKKNNPTWNGSSTWLAACTASCETLSLVTQRIILRVTTSTAVCVQNVGKGAVNEWSQLGRCCH